MGCGLVVLGAGECGGLLDGSSVRTDGWPDGGVLLPRGGKESMWVTLCPQNDEFPRHGGVHLGGGEGSQGHSRQGDAPGAEGRRKKGEIGGGKSPAGLPETCHPGRVGHQLPPSLLSQRLLPASRQGEPGARRCWLVSRGGQGTRKENHFPPPSSIVLQAGSKGMFFSCIPCSLTSPHHPQGDASSGSPQGSAEQLCCEGTWAGVGGFHPSE